MLNAAALPSVSTKATIRRPFNPLIALAAELVFLLALLLPSSKSTLYLRRALFFPTICALHLYTILFTTTSNSGGDYGLGSTLMTRILTASDILLLSADPQNDFYQVGRDGKPINKASAMPIWKRVGWAMKLMFNPRGIGWNHSIFQFNPQPITVPSRWAFVRARLIDILTCYILVDITQTYQHTALIYSEILRDPNASIATQGYILRCTSLAIWATAASSVLAVQHFLVAAIAVAIGVSEPNEWPRAFGSLKDAYTIRRIWGRTWHQLFRRIFLAHGQFITRCLSIKHEPLSISIHVLIAFLLSFLIHSVGGDYMLSQTVWAISARFFLVQPVGIALEALTIASTRSFGVPNNVKRCAGYTWVFLWFSWCAVDMVDGLLRAGLAEGELVPISVVRGLWKGQWLVGI